ncbi:MAG: N-acetylglucosamine-6-phosphate deacetylase, partial [Actinobacteria bacterium]|nr:N-acetylglucosamine-6-phosphate deacetylase [Actinomycetota bacterium]
MITPSLLILSDEIYTEQGVVSGYLAVRDRVIISIGEGSSLPRAGEFAGNVIDARGFRVIPGLIDLHIHGCLGFTVEGADAGAIGRMAKELARQGVTAFYPTLAAVAADVMEKSIAAVRDAMAAPDAADVIAASDAPDEGGSMAGYSGPQARILGLHLEGPFLNPRRSGAIRASALRAPSPALAERLLEMGQGAVRRVTLAPELPGAIDVVRSLASRGILVAGGHTDATFEETVAAIDAGIRLCNHTFNAMKALHHREPGPLGAYLTDDRVDCEVIADGIHVHPGAIKLVLKAKGLNRVCLISDSILSGLPPGTYAWGEQRISVDPGGACRLPDGTIAGSAATLMDGLRNSVEMLGLSLPDALRLASANPARLAGVGAKKGGLSPGKDADLVIIDSRYRVVASVIE